VLEKYFHSQLLPHKHHKISKNVPNQGHCVAEIALDYQDHCHGKSPGHLGGCGISQNARLKPELSLLSQKQRNRKQRKGYVPPSRFVFRLWKSIRISIVEVFNSMRMQSPLFRLGGQIEFGILYIHTQLKTTVYVGITTKKYPNQAKKRPSHARSSRTLPLPPPTSLQ
jgi:hypothetical protein